MSTEARTPKPSTLRINSTVSSETALDEIPQLRRGVNADESHDEDSASEKAVADDDENETEETSEEFIKKRTRASHCDDEVCSDASDCAACGARDCPLGAIEHYWHDGCPSCWVEAERAKKAAKAAVDKAVIDDKRPPSREQIEVNK
jgi:hypothetical protein